MTLVPWSSTLKGRRRVPTELYNLMKTRKKLISKVEEHENKLVVFFSHKPLQEDTHTKNDGRLVTKFD